MGLIEDAYSYPYMRVRDIFGPYAAVIFPAAAHQALQTSRPVEIFGALVQYVATSSRLSLSGDAMHQMLELYVHLQDLFRELDAGILPENQRRSAMAPNLFEVDPETEGVSFEPIGDSLARLAENNPIFGFESD